MKEIVKYKCEYCGTVFDELNECETCESNHQHPINTTGELYNPGSQYPHSVVIKFKNGASIVYKKG